MNNLNPKAVADALHAAGSWELVEAQLASHIADTLRSALASKGRASVAFSGGSTPAGMMRHLAAESLDWSKVFVTLVDERCVAPTHERSNAKLLKENFLDLLATPANFEPLFLDAESTTERAQRLAVFQLPFDVVHLGMGTDAHTASFFPDADNVAAMIDKAGVDSLALTRSEASVEDRITWTLPALIDATSIVLQIKGEGKSEVLLDALQRLSSASSDDETQTVRCEKPIAAMISYRNLVVAGAAESASVDRPLAVYYAKN